jgi:hypothetical protein
MLPKRYSRLKLQIAADAEESKSSLFIESYEAADGERDTEAK